MTFPIKDWKDSPVLTTPLAAAALEDMEGRLSAYAEAITSVAELGYAEITSNATRNATSYADIAGLSVTVTVASRPIMVKFSCGGVGSDTAPLGGWSVAFLQDGTIKAAAGNIPSATTEVSSYEKSIRLNPAAGSHTYKLQLKTAFAGTATIYADNYTTIGPAFIQVLQV